MNYKKAVNKAVIIAASILGLTMLSGCEKSTTDATASFKMPEGMEDCKVYVMSSSNGSNLIVVRCPNSTTTTRSGKSTNVTVVDTTNSVSEKIVPKSSEVQQGKNTDEVQINGETYRKSESMKEIEINGETYKKVQ